MNTTFMTYRDECEKLREEVERLRAKNALLEESCDLTLDKIERQSAALELAKVALSCVVEMNPALPMGMIEDACSALAAINALPAAPKGGA